MHTQVPDLLELLSTAAGCDYLSDLRQPGHFPALRRAVRACAAADYPARQWREALAYVRGAQTGDIPAEQARQQLLAYLDDQLLRH